MRARSLPHLAALVASLAVHGALAAWLLMGSAVAPAKTEMTEAQPSARLAGDTFEIPVEPTPEPVPAAATNSLPEVSSVNPVAAATAAASPTTAANIAPNRAPTPERASAAAASPTANTATELHPRRPQSSGAPPPITLYGAVGDRSAVDLATSFAKSFPQASRADVQWVTTPFGSAGEADVTLVLDPSGHLGPAPEISGSATPALRTGIMRTFWLIHGHAFIAVGPRTTLHVSAAITARPVPRLALGDSPFVSGIASSFIELPPDRRIDVHVKSLP